MKTALVTGGSGGMGAAICQRLAADGCHVYVHAHHGLEAAQRLVDRICAGGGSAEALVFDVTDSSAVTDALTPIIEHKPIQILVNNAGIHDDAIFPGMRAEQWHRVIDVSVNGFFNVTHTLMMPMIRSRWGRIVNVSSIAALTGNRGQVNYSAAKGAINSATKSLAQEVASRGITVNAVAPGIIDTAMSASAFKADDIARLVPMKRVGQPSEVADLIGFLASEQAAYITGQIISINGGMI
ncbi:MAG: 3-oxoacyl-ACP reductase FabG [Rhodoferax sp.]|uniref:3-oxoacyl-ACP reductase FabG n=1 Tax=Rhodoferax sp. TaxID=50421 RepID=UPI0017B824D4|nr:3-oxoacyl-ACP reductase FabG [Rhodoferax sp.]NMM14265.1 3-oxoacyl-ACP reductase FabG [Rhodoferax sp.]NMM19587.1 3-oxoacyl-ACP reductase FabG [Rhodoferax sp.]